MKKRWIIGIAIFLLAAACLLPQLAANAHFLFSHETDKFTMAPADGWAAILAGGKPLQFYLIFCAGVALVLGAVLLTANYLDYQSGVQVITPKISTPLPAGQGQFGTARWLPKEQLHRTFASWRLTRRQTKELTALGKDAYRQVRVFRREHPEAIKNVEE